MPIASEPTHPPRVAVVVPCYRETGNVLGVLAGIGPEVDDIVVVDDACPDGTGAHVTEACNDPRVRVLTHPANTGVGGATLTGYEEALARGAEIIVKLDGDGQMDPARIGDLVKPIAEGRADYVKGNRFHDLDGLRQMPVLRLMGNLVLSFASKLSSGYWNVFDPNNGFTAIHAAIARRLPAGSISRGYFFESDMLFRLNLLGAVVADLPMEARYGNEESGVNLFSALFEFSYKHWRNTMKRVFYAYFLRDFSVASVQLVLGSALLLFGIVFGAIEWRLSVTSGVPATAGTVVLAALPVILGSQFLIAFLDYDTRNVPKTPIHPRL